VDGDAGKRADGAAQVKPDVFFLDAYGFEGLD
jgi:hypothetical protein